MGRFESVTLWTLERGVGMYGYLSGFSDTNRIRYCPNCGEEVSNSYSDGTCECEACNIRFGVIEVEEEDE